MDNHHLHTDVAILKRLVEGDETAFRLIYDRHWNRVFSTALAITQSAHLAKDVVQDTFSVIWKNREKLAEIENIEAYIYVTARNRITSLLRNKHDYQQSDILNSLIFKDDALSPERLVSLKEFRKRVDQAIKMLPPQQARAFKLSRLEEKSYEEIAEIMGVSKDTVRNHMIKALSFMRTFFADRQEDFLFLMLLLTGSLLFF